MKSVINKFSTALYYCSGIGALLYEFLSIWTIYWTELFKGILCKLIPCFFTECQIYKRRWLILLLFVFYSMSNAMQWVQYSIIENVVTKFYGLEGTSWIEWTSMVYMLTYIFLILPGSWALDKFVCKTLIPILFHK